MPVRPSAPPLARRPLLKAGLAAVTLGLATPALLTTRARAQVLQSRDHAIRVTRVVEPLVHPWAIAFLPDGDMLVTERPGRLRRVRPGVSAEVVAGVPAVVDRGQGGLLDVAIDPEFDGTGWIYLSYAAAVDGGQTTAVDRARLDGWQLAERTRLFTASPGFRSTQHFGSRLALTPAGHVFITVGDRGNRHQAQDRGNHIGSLIRIARDGMVPADNPFVGQPDARPELYSYGHRNPQGLALHPETGAPWLHEHGPRGGDEVNIARPGRNYGWPVITYGREYSGGRVGDGRTEAPGMEQPILHWTPSIAPSGMTFYTGDAFPAWRGNLFAGALALTHLRRVVLDGTTVFGQEELLQPLGLRIRDVRTGPDGLLYLATDASRAGVLRLEPA